ncbi:MAG: hypothetical protein HY653_01985 [Acidobacteria bacterium]|nr:hypothetical protein [Acidobacteriota bacterium]
MPELPFRKNPAKLELVEESRNYAPGENIQVRLTNRSDEPMYIITEVQAGVRTDQGKRLPGQPVYERRKHKFFFRSERWVYAGQRGARFRVASLAPGDSVVFPVSFSPPAKYKVHLRFWRTQDIGDSEQFLKLDVQQIEEQFNRKARWTSTASFRIRKPEADKAKK